MARSWGVTVEERRVAIDEVLAAHGSGQLREIFGSGTAAVVSPVGEIHYGEEALTVGGGKVGPLAQRLYDSLTDIQYGRSADPFGWVVPVT
jgi:branched-chain amino acid aminotransferase